jgi:hypothetical protein
MTIVGPVRGDSIGRVAVRVGSRTAMAVLLAQDVGITLGARLSAGGVRVFGTDSSAALIDLITIGPAKLGNVPAAVGGGAGVITIGLSATGPLVPTFDFSKNRLTFNRQLSTVAPIRLPMIRYEGAVHVLDRGRWVALADYLAGAAKARQAVTVDFRAGEIRVQP